MSATVRFRVADPTSFATRLGKALGAADPGGSTEITLANAVLLVELGAPGRRPVEVEVDEIREKGPRSEGPRVIALGWATVDADRAESPQSAAQAAVPAAVSDTALGARLRWVGRQPDVPFDVVLLEPDREGPLAAALARHGEGPVAVYVRSGRPTPVHLGGSRFGPWIVVDPAPWPERGPGTIRRVNERSGANATAPSIVLRRAIPDDAARIASLLTDEGYPVAPSDIAVRLERFSPPSAVVVAVADGEVLGFLAAHVMPRFEHPDAIVRILALVVDPGVRERGIGGLLLAEAERIGRGSAAAFAEVTSGHHRPDARRLYESLGFDAGVTTYLRKRL